VVTWVTCVGRGAELVEKDLLVGWVLGCRFLVRDEVLEARDRGFEVGEFGGHLLQVGMVVFCRLGVLLRGDGVDRVVQFCA